jgi:hypothetical protein
MLLEKEHEPVFDEQLVRVFEGGCTIAARTNSAGSIGGSKIGSWRTTPSMFMQCRFSRYPTL